MPTEVIGEGVIVITADVDKAIAGHEKAEKAAEKSRKAQEAEHAKVTKAAEKAAKAQAAAAQKAQKAAEAAAKQTAQAWQTNLGKVSGAAGAMSSKLGPAFGSIGGAANSALKPILEVAAGLGSLGVAAGGIVAVGAAMGAGVVAAKGLADSALAARDRLEAVGIQVGAEAKKDLDAYAAAMAGVAVSLDKAKVAAGSGIAGELAVLTTGLRMSAKAIAETTNNGEGLANLLAYTLPPGLAKFAEANADLYSAVTEGARTATEAEGKLYAAQLRRDAMFAGDVPFGPSIDLKGPNIAKQASAEEAAIKAKTAAQQKYADVVDKGNVEAAAASKAARMDASALDGYINSLILQGKAAGEASVEINEQIDDWFQKYGNETVPKVKESFAEISAAALGFGDQIAGSLATVFDVLAERQVEAAGRVDAATNEARANQRDVRKEIAALNRESTAETSAARAAEIEGQIASLEAVRTTNREKIKAAQAVSDDLRERNYRAFVAEKVAGIGQVAIQTSVALMTALGQLGPIAGAFAAAGIIAAGATSAGVIASQKPPEFPMGRVPMGSPDHQGGLLQPREAAAIPRNEEDRREIRRMNEGRSGTTEVVVMIGRREIARANGRGTVRIDPRAGKLPRRGR